MRLKQISGVYVGEPWFNHWEYEKNLTKNVNGLARWDCDEQALQRLSRATDRIYQSLHDESRKDKHFS